LQGRLEELHLLLSSSFPVGGFLRWRTRVGGLCAEIRPLC
jgi:hypothetical protein